MSILRSMLKISIMRNSVNVMKKRILVMLVVFVVNLVKFSRLVIREIMKRMIVSLIMFIVFWLFLGMIGMNL